VNPSLDEARVIVPVRNGGARWVEAASALCQAVAEPSLVVVVDSSSSDGSDRVAEERGFELLRIPPGAFSHGGTRQDAIARFCGGCEFVVFLTQDAVVEGPESLTELLAAFGDERIGAAYGRQLPHHGANRFETHAARYNYGPVSETRCLADRDRLGFKVSFLSNSFAAYRIDVLKEVGGFPDHIIVSEDAFVAMRLLLAGWRIAYRAEARVRHSHDSTMWYEMRRNFDFGVMHAQTPELLQTFGAAERWGIRFVLSELQYMLGVAPCQLAPALLRTLAKWGGYRLGLKFELLPPAWRPRLSMTKAYWNPNSVDGPRRSLSRGWDQ
jgi:rhamnosyltransferase